MTTVQNSLLLFVPRDFKTILRFPLARMLWLQLTAEANSGDNVCHWLGPLPQGIPHFPVSSHPNYLKHKP